MPDRHSNEAARAQGPDPDDPDAPVPANLADVRTSLANLADVLEGSHGCACRGMIASIDANLEEIAGRLDRLVNAWSPARGSLETRDVLISIMEPEA